MLLLDLIEASGAEHTRKGTEVKVDCPFCELRGHSPDEEKHLGINIRRGVAHCYRCDWASGGIYNTAKQLARIWGIKLDLRQALKKISEEKASESEEKILPIGLPDGYERFLNDPTDEIERAARLYLKERSVTRVQIAKHDIGYAIAGQFAGRIILPVKGSDQKIYGCVGRSFYNQDPKYFNTHGLKLLWNGHRKGDTCVLCEGVMDALRIENALLNIPGSVVPAATLGCAITDHQIDQLKRFKKVIVFPDFDRPGIAGAIGLLDKCSRLNPSVILPHDLDDRDPGDLALEEIVYCVRERVEPWKVATHRRLKRLVAATGSNFPTL